MPNSFDLKPCFPLTSEVFLGNLLNFYLYEFLKLQIGMLINFPQRVFTIVEDY